MTQINRNVFPLSFAPDFPGLKPQPDTLSVLLRVDLHAHIITFTIYTKDKNCFMDFAYLLYI